MRIWLSKNSEVPIREQLSTQILLGISAANATVRHSLWRQAPDKSPP